MLSFSHRGNFKLTNDFLNNALSKKHLAHLHAFGEKGVAALRRATPKDSGDTAQNWTYEIKTRPGYTVVMWNNGTSPGEAPLVYLLQYGHGTRQGGYVRGTDFINPAMKPIFDAMEKDVMDNLNR